MVPLTDVKAPVNGGGDGADLGTELLLDPSEGVTILVRDEVDGKAEVAEPSRAADAVQVGLGVLGEVEVNNNVDGLDVDTAGEEVRRHEVAGGTVAELMEDTVAVGLLHLGVDVVAGVPELGDLLARSSTRLTELQKMMDWLISSLEKRVLRQWTFCRSST